MNKELLNETTLHDFSNIRIKNLIKEKGWMNLEKEKALKEIYNFVKDDILFGYNKDDKTKASIVLKEGIGQCNTKAILFMALLRAVNIPCYIKGFTIDKALQYGSMTSFVYKASPKEIIHSYVVVLLNDVEYELEGLILDDNYLKALQKKFNHIDGKFIGYGVATDNFQNPQVEFNNCNTYIQNKGIVKVLGSFNDMDTFLDNYHQDINIFKKFVFRYFARRLMNKNVKKIRKSA